MVVAAGDLELLVRLVDARADLGGLAEVERRAGNGLDAAYGDEAGVDGGVAVGVDVEDFAEDGAGAFAGEVEVGVVGEVGDGGLVGGGGVVDVQRGADQRVADVHGERAGKAHVAVGRDQRHFDAVGDLLAGPELVVEAVRAAVERVAVIVRRDLVGVAVDGELAGANAVAVAADDGAEVGLGAGGCFGDVSVDRVVAEHHVGDLAVAVLGLQGDDARAVGGDPTSRSAFFSVYTSAALPSGSLPKSALVTVTAATAPCTPNVVIMDSTITFANLIVIIPQLVVRSPVARWLLPGAIVARQSLRGCRCSEERRTSTAGVCFRTAHYT